MTIAAELQRRAQAQTVEASRPIPNVADWIAAEVVIEDPHDLEVVLVPFDLWPSQRETLQTILASNNVIILKARQLGISWLVIAFAVWLCLYHDHQTVLVFSKDQDSANEMIRRARGIYLRLKARPIALAVDNVTAIEWQNGSRIKSFAATEDAGSSFTGSLIIADEFAKMRYAESLYTSIKPTINDGGRIVIISTAKGESNLFHKLWKAAEKGLNSFKDIFLAWTARPSRTPEWYAQAERDAISPEHHHQEYPSNSDEAFSNLGNDRFLPSMALWDACREDLPALGKQEPLVVALDAAVTNDSFGIVGVTRHPARHDDVAVRIVREWKPSGGKIDFEGTEDNPGPLRFVRWLGDNYNVVQVTFDPTELKYAAQLIRAEGKLWLKEFSQQADRLEADKQLLDLIMQKRIAHDGNADLRRHCDNADRKPDAETRRLRIVKREQDKKIDIIVALSMACAECLRLSI